MDNMLNPETTGKISFWLAALPWLFVGALQLGVPGFG
jgi:hypothetical protein